MPIERTTEREEHWRYLEEAARRALHGAFEVQPKVKAWAVLRLWEEPALEDPVRSWTVGYVGKIAKPASAVVRRVTWLRSADFSQAFDSMESLLNGRAMAPRLELVDARISLARLKSELAKARRIRFTALGVSGPLGLDGHVSGVWFRSGFNESRFEWWTYGPPEWARLRAWHRDAERWLNECARRAARRGAVTLYPQEAFIRSVQRGERVDGA